VERASHATHSEEKGMIRRLATRVQLPQHLPMHARESSAPRYVLSSAFNPSPTYIRHRVISVSTTPTASLGTSVLSFARGSYPVSSRSGGRIRGRRSSRAGVSVAGVVLRYEEIIGAFDSTAARLINVADFSYSSRVLRTRPVRPFASTYRPEIYNA
jgi:hypothetical protein